jgi:hypothetical protein
MTSFQQISDRLIPIKQYSTPTTGSTVSVNANGYVCLFLNPAGSLVALTVSLPSSPTDGDVVEIHSSQAITTLTMSNGTIIGALTTMAIAAFAKYRYYSDTTSWARVG